MLAFQHIPTLGGEESLTRSLWMKVDSTLAWLTILTYFDCCCLQMSFKARSVIDFGSSISRVLTITWLDVYSLSKFSSGKLTVRYGKSPSSIGKSTINVPFSVTMLNFQRVTSHVRLWSSRPCRYWPRSKLMRWLLGYEGDIPSQNKGWNTSFH